MLKQTLVAGAVLLLSAAPAFASVSVDNSADVEVVSVTVANSGLNGVVTGGGEVEHSSVTSGNAVADATVGTEVNSNKVNVSGWGCVSVDNEDTTVGVLQVTVANSGLNGVMTGGEDAEHVTVTSGDASATSNTQTLVNVNDVKVDNSFAL